VPTLCNSMRALPKTSRTITEMGILSMAAESGPSVPVLHVKQDKLCSWIFWASQCLVCGFVACRTVHCCASGRCWRTTSKTLTASAGTRTWRRFGGRSWTDCCLSEAPLLCRFLWTCAHRSVACFGPLRVSTGSLLGCAVRCSGLPRWVSHAALLAWVGAGLTARWQASSAASAN
jgi:hypothetical protein